MNWDVFWAVLFVMFVMVPLFMIWAFAIVDLFQRTDLRGWVKVLWLLGILIFPILGTLVYYLVRPPLPAGASKYGMADTEYERAQAGYVVDKLTELTALRDRGAISPDEYEQQRSRLLSA